MIAKGHPTNAQEVIDCLAVMEEALDGDGSTEYMPDVTRSDAARWTLSALVAKGYRIICPEPA